MTRTRLTRLGRSLACCLQALGLAAWCRAETSSENLPAEALVRRADAAERAARTNDAITAYTLLLDQDAAFEPAVGPRLVDLLVGSNQPAEALAWARRVSRKRPDPAAYLAGVYARLGLWKESELLLRKTLAQTPDANTRIPLLWQLAEAQEQQGDRAAARDALTKARDTAPDDALKTTSSRRLEALKQRAGPARPADPAKPEAEDSP